MVSQKIFQAAVIGKLSMVIALGLAITTLFWVIVIFLPPSAAQEPTLAPLSTQGNWPLHLYASPSAPDGKGLWASTGKTGDACEKVDFVAKLLGKVPTPVEGEYNPDLNIYRVFLDNFFYDDDDDKIDDTQVQIGDLYAVCELANGNRLKTTDKIFKRYHYPNDDSEVNVAVGDDDQQAVLTLNSSSLNSKMFIIVTRGNVLPGPLPPGVTAIGLPYSFNGFVTKPYSDGKMLLNLYFDLSTAKNPLTQRIFEWDVVSNSWLDLGDQGLSVSVNPRLNKTTTKFTTYILVNTPRWRDSFVTLATIGIDAKKNMSYITYPGKLELEDMALNGTVISTPYTPTMPIQAWQSISYTANITAGTSMTVSVLSLDHTAVLTHVSPGDSLSSIDPTLYSSLRLRVDMSTTSMGTSPELFEWSILAKPDLKAVYLPLVLK